MALRDLSLCSGCLEKMRRIDRLNRKVKRQARQITELQKKLNAVPRTINEAPFGPSTSSSRVPIKPGSPEERRQRKGGASPGHKGHGRKVAEAPDVTELQALPPHCPDCGGAVLCETTYQRTVKEIIPQRTVNRRILVECGHCSQCGLKVENPVPGVFPRAKYSNGFNANVAYQHYVMGRTQGEVCREAGIGTGPFNHAMHALAERLRPCLMPLHDQFRQAAVRFADETGWREDGSNRYAWLLSTLTVSLFLVGRSRATVVPMELFEPLIREGCMASGVLVVDRYAVYARLPVALQYCYAHLKRDVEQLAGQFPDDAEVQGFCKLLGKLLAKAMGLRRRKISDRRYYQAAAILRDRIIAACAQEARHPGVQSLQDIFRQNPHRLYHWANDRRVPADNNYSERSLRPLVIARKLSFGSQSPRGAGTRETIMSVMHSLAKQGHDPVARVTAALDALARDPAFAIADFLFPPGPPPVPLRQPQPAPSPQPELAKRSA